MSLEQNIRILTQTQLLCVRQFKAVA